MATTTERVGRYQLLEPIGIGPCGSVSRSKVFGVAGFERQFAVKRFSTEVTGTAALAQALSAAARAYGSLEHPRIARMSEFGVAQGTTFAAIEYVGGLDALRLIAEARTAGAPLAPGGALALVSQAARAVGYAHGRGLTHLGLAPTNVIVTPDGDVKITDFGILAATLPPRPIDVARLAQRIAYLAPEQLANEATSAATDVFALGVLAYELITGQRTFRGDTPQQIAQAVMAGPPAEPPLPRPITRVLQRCLARSPFERFPDARALADALDAAIRVAPVPGTRKDIGAQVHEAVERAARLREGELSGVLALNVGTGPAPRDRERAALAPVAPLVPPIPVPSPAPVQPTISAPPPLPPPPSSLAAPGTLLGLPMTKVPAVPRLAPQQPMTVPKVVPQRSPVAVLAPAMPAPASPAPASSAEPAAGAKELPSANDVDSALELFGSDDEPRPSTPTVVERETPTSVYPNPKRAETSGYESEDPTKVRPRIAEPPIAEPQVIEMTAEPAAEPAAVERVDDVTTRPVARLPEETPPPAEDRTGSSPKSPPLFAPPSRPVLPMPAPERTPTPEPRTLPVRRRDPERDLDTVDVPPVPPAAPARSRVPLILGITALVGALGAGGWFAYDALIAGDEPAPPTTTAPTTAPTTPIATTTPDDPTPPRLASAPADAARAPDKVPPVVPEGKPAPSDALAITSTPPGARVFVDGSDAGVTPLKLPGTPDRHTIAVLLAGHALHVAEVEGNGTHAVTLEEITPSGGPAGIKVIRCKHKDRYYVFVDGKPTGMTCPTERIEVEIGTHTVEVYDLVSETHRKWDVQVKDTRLSYRVKVD